MVQLLCILISLIVGYSFKKLPVNMHILNNILKYAIIFILFIMGYNFGSEPKFINNILQTSKIVAVVSICLVVFNFIAITAYTTLKTKIKLNINNNLQTIKFRNYVFESGKYLIYIISGITTGYILHIQLAHLEFIVNFVLFILLFIIGFQLRHQNISLKSLLINRMGIIVAALILSSSIIAGIVSAIILNLNINTGLVLSCGFGWYTLSGILSGQLINPQMGAASFFIDFLREIIAIVLIPLLGRTIPIFCIGYSGATALDFTLPIIKINLGEEAASLGITSGMILTILVPIIIPLLWNLKI